MTEDTPAPGDWNGWLKHDVEHARRMLMEHGFVNSMFVLHGSDGKMKVVSTPFETSEDKERTYWLIEQVCIAYDVIGLSSLSEAWVRIMDNRAGETNEQKMKRSMEIRPSEAPDRKEVVVVAMIYREHDKRKTLLDLREIIRGEAGTPVDLRQLMPIDGLTGEGAVPDILPIKTPSAIEQAMAKATLDRMFGPDAFGEQ